MPGPAHFQSLLSRFVVLVVVPLSLVLFGTIVVSLVAYEKVLTTLLVDRDQQLASLVTARVSEAIAGYARLLEMLATQPELQGGQADTWTQVLTRSPYTLQVFDAGIVFVDRDGRTLVATSPVSPVAPVVADEDYFRAVRDQRQPVFSNVLQHAHDGQNLFIIAVPLLDGQHNFTGALLGAVYLAHTPLAATLQQLTIGKNGYAYVVDAKGRVIFHPNVAYLGMDFTDRPFVRNVMAGEGGGTLWTSPTGERLVLGYQPIPGAGWGLIVREPWADVSAPARIYGFGTVLAGLLALAVAAYFLWRGVRDITVPVHRLAEQTARLAAGEQIQPVVPGNIQEIGALSRHFNDMAKQVAAYRAGWRRYLGAITQAQEDERRRVARDLHDETVQSLLAVGRRLELLQSAENMPETLKPSFAELQTMVADTLSDVRQISQDLRPPALDDLGLIPALRTLVRTVRNGPGAVAQAEFGVVGRPAPLTSEQELALYRITQEALTNIRKHAGATSIRIELKFEPTCVQLEIADDGQGFNVPVSFAALAQDGHFGLLGMQERALAVGGTLSFTSAPGQGSCVQVITPLAGHPPA